jgi:hypothetical protein
MPVKVNRDKLIAAMQKHAEHLKGEHSKAVSKYEKELPAARKAIAAALQDSIKIVLSDEKALAQCGHGRSYSNGDYVYHLQVPTKVYKLEIPTRPLPSGELERIERAIKRLALSDEPVLNLKDDDDYLRYI